MDSRGSKLGVSSNPTRTTSANAHDRINLDVPGRHEPGARDRFSTEFTSPQALRQYIETTDGGRYEVWGVSGDRESGTIMYMDTSASDGVVYELSYDATYNVSGTIRVSSIRRYSS